MGLSGLGIFHTLIGIIAIFAALTSFIRFGKIDLTHISGKTYFLTTVITALTALGLSKHGGFNPGHIFSIFIFLIVLIAFWLSAKKKGLNKFRYFENFLLSLSFFLSLIPTVNETFTRVPIGHPLASGPTDPVIAKTLGVILLGFIIGAIYQYIQQRRIVKRDQLIKG